jgi:tetratricopeptide (TPR) repeat protein
MTRKQSKKAKKKVQQKSTLNKMHIYGLLIILVVTFIAYFPTFQNEFTNWDDDKYIIENLDIRSLGVENIKAFFSDIHMGNYHPFTMLSFAIDYQISGLSPNMYHFTNILLHLINTALVFWLILLLLNHIQHKKSFEIAIITAALFGVNTLHVESVTWISERKDVLFSMFYLFSLIAYVKYVIKKKNVFYFYSIVLFLLSLFSKGQAVSLALTVMAIDYLFSRKLLNRKVIIEKIPFFALSITFGIIAIYAQRSTDSIQSNIVFSIDERILFACYGLIQYIIKLIIPLRLSAFYPYPDKVDASVPIEYLLYLFFVIAIIVLFIYLIKKQRKTLAFGFLFFLINIFLVLQLLPVGNAIMADRYSYIPSIGLFFIIGLVYVWILDNMKYRLIFWTRITFLIYFVFLSVLTFNRAKIWNNSIILWSDVINKYPTTYLSYFNRGRAKQELGDIESALIDYNEALRINPDYYLAYNGRGFIKNKLGDYEGALEDINSAILIKPEFYHAYVNRGNIKVVLKDYENALKDFDKAISLNPGFSLSFMNRGNIKKELGDFYGAIDDYSAAINIDPYYSMAFVNRGLVKYQLEDFEGALSDFNTVIMQMPNVPHYYDVRGVIKASLKQYNNALNDFNMAIKLNFNNVNAYLNRARTLMSLGKFDKAKQDVLKAQSLGCEVSPYLIKKIDDGLNNASK